ncbi:unnamed protein product [Effrenium voratum]|nr:unnamed protein product [Effrenium voratum]
MDQGSQNTEANEATRKKSPGYLNQRSQLREMVATMTKTMTQTFDRSVWDACDVAHPDQEQERLHAARAKVVEAQLEQFKGLKPAIKGRRASRDEKRDSARRSFGIMSRTGALPPTEMTDEKLLAHLARQTGWSVLDVEEVWEVFFAFAPTGRIAVQAPEFIQLVQELYEGVSDDEIMLLQQHINAVRTRNQTRARFMRRALTGLDNNAPERADVRFSEFYMALVKWLDLQQSRMEARTEVKDRMKSRCSLSRFAAGSLLQLQMPKSSISNISMSAGNMNLEDFRKLKKEVEASSPRSQRDGGIGNAMLVRKKQREGKASRKRASKETWRKRRARMSQTMMMMMTTAVRTCQPFHWVAHFDIDVAVPPCLLHFGFKLVSGPVQCRSPKRVQFVGPSGLP